MATETSDERKESSSEEERDRRESPDFWRKWIRAAETAASDHWKNAREAWGEYEKKCEEGEKPYPIYWSSCKTLEPAFYSRTPKILSRRRAGISDPTALTMSLIIERLGEYAVENCDFDDIMQGAVLDFIHADKATTQVKYEEVKRKVQKKNPLWVDQNGQLVDENGEIFTGDVRMDDGKTPYYLSEEVVLRPVVKLMPCPYDEILHTPDAKCEDEIEDRAYYFFLSKEAAEARFPGKEISWKTGPREKRNEEKTESPEHIGPYLEGWECWSSATKRVYWFSEQFNGGFLDVKDDIYDLRQFFPSPKFIIGSRPSKHLYPTSAFVQLRSLIKQLHSSESRVMTLTERVRRCALVDGANPELLTALTILKDAEFIACENLQQLLEKNGVENLVWFIPVKELVDAISELSAIQEKLKNQFFEWFRVPDILRGATDPLETAAAQEMKSGAANDTFKSLKKLVARLARDSIELMIDMILRRFSDDEIARIVNADYLEEPHRQRFSEALTALREDELRSVRVDVDTDSMSFLDDQLRAQKVNAGVVTLTRGLEQIAQMLQTSPDYANVALQALLLSLEAMGLGKEFEDLVRSSVNALIEKAKNPPPPPPPPPDYEAMKIQVNQMKVEGQIAARQRELDQGEYRLMLQQQVEGARAENNRMLTEIKMYKTDLDQAVQNFMMQIESQRLQIEAFKADVQARESQMEEIRLAKEVEVEQYKALNGIAETEGPASAQPPVINVIQPPATQVVQTPPTAVVVEAPAAAPVVDPLAALINSGL